MRRRPAPRKPLSGGSRSAASRRRLYITNSAVHNPTGASLPPAVAHRLLKLAEQHDLTIAEDDIFGDFEHEPSPLRAAFDGLERVVHIASFSKTLSPSVRCGYAAARRDWIEGLAAAVRKAERTTSLDGIDAGNSV